MDLSAFSHDLHVERPLTCGCMSQNDLLRALDHCKQRPSTQSRQSQSRTSNRRRNLSCPAPRPTWAGGGRREPPKLTAGFYFDAKLRPYLPPSRLGGVDHDSSRRSSRERSAIAT